MSEQRPRPVQLLDALTDLLAGPAGTDWPRVGVSIDTMAFGPTEPLIGADAITTLLDRPDLEDVPPLRLGRVEDSRSAWFWAAAPSGTPAKRSRWRISGLLTATDDRNWTVDHLHFSHGLPNATIGDYTQACPTLPPVGESVAPGAIELVHLVQGNLGSGKLALLADRADTVVIGTDPEELWEGHDSFVATFTPMLDQIRALEPISRYDYPGGIRARLTADDSCGYVATNIVGTFGEDRLPPFRLSWIFARVDGSYRLVSDHHSAAVG